MYRYVKGKGWLFGEYHSFEFITRDGVRMLAEERAPENVREYCSYTRDDEIPEDYFATWHSDMFGYSGLSIVSCWLKTGYRVWTLTKL